MKSNLSTDNDNLSIIGNRFQIILLTLAVIMTGAVFGLFIWHTQYLENNTELRQSADAGENQPIAELVGEIENERFLMPLSVVVFSFSVFAWLTIIRTLQNSQKYLLTVNLEKDRMQNALRESMQYENLFHHANDAILIFEPDTEIVLQVNDKACETYRRRRRDFIGRSLKDITRNVSRGTEELEKLLHDGVYDEFESVHLRGDGEPIDLLINAAVIDYRGRKAVLTINRDITGRKQIEEDLRASEERFRAVTNSARDAIISADGRGNIVFWNREAENIFGYTASEIIGKSLQEIMPAQHRNAHQNGLEHNVATGKNRLVGKTVEVPGRRKNGTEFPLELTLGTWESQQGKFFTAVMRDITERKRTEEILQKNISILTSTLESTADGILVVGANNEIVTFNEKFARIWGMTAEELNALPSASAPQRISEQIVQDDDNQGKINDVDLFADESTFDILELKSGKIYERYSQPQRLGNDIVGRVFSFHDITERKNAENNLRHSEADLAAAQRILHLGNWEIELLDFRHFQNNPVRWSDEVYRIFGSEPDRFNITLKYFFDAVHPDDRRMVRRAFLEAVGYRRNLDIEYRVVLPDGTERVQHGLGEILYDRKNNQPLKLVGTLQDITERKRAESETSRLAAIVESSGDAIISKNLDGIIVTWNSGAEKLFGYAASEIIGRHISILFPLERLGEETVIIERLKKGEIIEQFETTRVRKGGAAVSVSITVSPIKNANGETIGISKIAHDITERKRAEEQLLHDAFHDALTGLANRALFMDHLQFAIERGKSRHSNVYAVLFLDFDRFKVVNDSLGHVEGDNFLKIAAHRLENATRGSDLVARLGGDEFVVLLSELEKAEDAIRIAERVQENLKQSFKVGEREIFISASIGIALSTSGHTKADDMLRDADIAMYRAKAKGRAGYQIFDAAMGEQAARQLSLETEMRHALELGEFELHYQPIISLETGKLIGFESLVRWHHPTRGMIPPLEFIAAAEESNFILPLGRWILEESCRQMRKWQLIHSSADLTVSVNLSSKQFAQADLVAQVASALEKSQLSPHCLKLEITESHIMENSEQAILTMSDLRRFGIELSLDDFGTGYSSLSYLHRLPASYLKIDRSFVSRMTESEEKSEIVSTIIKLARSLKMKTIAEGIETEKQLHRIKEMNCDFGQGYLFSKPLAAQDAENFIERSSEFFTM